MSVVTVDNTLGVLYESVVVSAALYGAGCVQCWFYYQKYRERDPWYLKLLVSLVLLCDTCQQALLSACVYYYLVTEHDNPLALVKMEKTLIVEMFFSNTIQLLVQQFYCHRILRLSKSYTIWGCLAALSFSGFAILTAYSGQAIRFDTMQQITTLKKLSMSCNIVAAIIDITISVSLVWLLRSVKTGFKHTNSIINRLVVFSFSTGLPTSLCALGACIGIAVSPGTFIYMIFFFMMGRFYTNSLLVTLNAREFIVSSTSKGTESFSLSLRANGASAPSEVRFAGAKSISTAQQSKNAIAIKIEESKSTHEDYSPDSVTHKQEELV